MLSHILADPVSLVAGLPAKNPAFLHSEIHYRSVRMDGNPDLGND